MAMFTINHGKTSSHLKAFILNLPSIDLILGLPWYKENEPEIDFVTGSYTVNHQSGEVEWKTTIVPEDEDRPITLCTTDREENGDSSREIEDVAKRTVQDCVSQDIINIERKWTHSIDTGDNKPVNSRGRPHIS